MSYPFRRPGSSVAVLLCAALLPAVAAAQSGTAPVVSPVAPPTLKAPVFDTTRPVYNLPDVKKADSTVVAEVDGHAITLGQVTDAIQGLSPAEQRKPYDELFPNIVSQLVRIQALLGQARAEGLDQAPDIKRRMQTAADGVLAAEYIRRHSTDAVTEQAILDRYNREIAGKPGPEQVHLHGIQVATEDEARAVIKDLMNGADFATLARKSSRDVTSADGGDLGWKTRSQLAPAISGIAFGTPVGQLVPNPIAVGSTWLVIKVDQRRPGPTPSFAEMHDQIAEALARENAPRLADAAQSKALIRMYGLNGQELDYRTGEPLNIKSGHIVDGRD